MAKSSNYDLKHESLLLRLTNTALKIISKKFKKKKHKKVSKNMYFIKSYNVMN